MAHSADLKGWAFFIFSDTVRTVQEWLGHESLATMQKYLEPSKETETGARKAAGKEDRGEN
jgi:integrase